MCTGQEFEEAPDGEGTGTIAHEQGYVRLLNAERRRGLALGHSTAFDDAIDLQRQTCFDELLLRVGQAEIGKYIVAAGRDAAL